MTTASKNDTSMNLHIKNGRVIDPANGIDAVVGRRARVQQVERAAAAAELGQLDSCAAELVGLADDLIALPDRFRSAA